MPANLPPQYYEVEKRYRSATSAAEKMAALEEMLRIMPKHKGTDKLQADVKSRIAKLKTEGDKKGARRSSAPTVRPEGAGQIVMIGPANSGKSALTAALTRAEPEIAPWPGTTRLPLAGMAKYEDVQIQLVDLPPLDAERVEPWVFDIIRRADAALVLVDLADDPLHQLETVEKILADKKIGLAGGIEPAADWGALVKPCLLAANKLDADLAEDALLLFCEELGDERPVHALSVQQGDGLQETPRLLFELLDVIRVYTRTGGRSAELGDPYTLPRGSTVQDLAERIHKDVAASFKGARIWAEGKYDGQLVQRDYEIQDRDVMELLT